MRVRCGSPWVIVLGLLTASSACSGTRPEVKAALTGTLPELRQEIARAERSGPLDSDQLVALARAVAEREIAGAGGSEGAEQLALFRPCLAELEPALDERSERGDEAAAVATLLLFEAGKRKSTELLHRYREADSPAFRALAARAALGPADAELRRRYFTDPDERVRRSAFEAAIRSPEASQLPELLEAARLDPSAANRGKATQAIGRIGSDAAVMALMDLFAAGDEADQLAVIDAWSEPRTFARGGERELARALGRPGLIGVSAATLLLRSRESRAAAVGVLARAIEGGSDDERRLALAAAPLSDPSIKVALEKAAQSPSPEVTPLVLSRLAELPGMQAKARAGLEKLAEDKSDYGLEATYALARLGSAKAVVRLEQELSHQRSARRLRAALTLAGLGQRKQLAPRLADRDPFVRASLACRLTEAS